MFKARAHYCPEIFFKTTPTRYAQRAGNRRASMKDGHGTGWSSGRSYARACLPGLEWDTSRRIIHRQVSSSRVRRMSRFLTPPFFLSALVARLELNPKFCLLHAVYLMCHDDI